MAEDSPRPTFWTSLDEPSRLVLLRGGRHRRFRAGEHLCRQGEEPDHVLVIREGWAKVSVTGEDGREVVVAVRGPGDLIGEAGLITGAPRSATVTALHALQALSVPRVRFTAFLHDDPDGWPTLSSTVALRLAQSDHRFAAGGGTHLSGRLAAFLLRQAADNGRRLPDGGVLIPPLSQSELGSCIDASRETVARALRDWRALGLVETGWRRTILRNPAALHTHTTTPDR
ncbi:Crp/Fnr family transcriptional regulator [Actinocorallia sp. A-T 12471]|uniref:Crp/Fnr family transcriptional regulator n=1 Tax=Actinocorallia sp. A-T 12471 TaxID=3089813 RepID=UPI0029D3693D|nr:Crp/Fnr family transcriptional regulator [Actinocorallia sp. A-T 12471]MDX6744263.1 Crp/Fnr family transcriptional regulator [Actinocorallia sp. A-T 12471]